MATFRVDGAREVQRMLSWYEGRELFNRLRRATRAGGKQFQAGLKEAASSEPTGRLPDTFRDVPAPKVSSSMRSGGVIASVKPKSPLYSIFEQGADAHAIDGTFLVGEPHERWRGRPFAARGGVRHPGFAERPIRPHAFAAKRSAASRAVTDVIFEPSR